MINPNLALYLFTHFFFALILISYGPMIPYLAEETHKREEEFAFLFTTRGVAFVIAGIMNKTLIKSYSLHIRMFSPALLLVLDIFSSHIH